MADLALMLRDRCRRLGFADAQIDVSLVDKTLIGFAIVNPAQERETLDQVLLAYAIDVVEESGVVRFIPRDRARQKSIDWSHLVPLDDGGARVRIRRRQRDEIPGAVQVTYVEPIEFETAVQTATSDADPNPHTEIINTPIVLNARSAKSLAERELRQLQTEIGSIEFAVTLRHFDLRPSDVVTISDDEGGRRYVARIVTLDWEGITGRITGVLTERAYLHQDGKVGAEPAIKPIEPKDIDGVAYHVLDIPTIDPALAATPHLYAVTGRVREAEKWDGAQVSRSLNGVDFAAVTEHGLSGRVGFTTTALPDGPLNVIDHAATVRVAMFDGQPLSISDEDFDAQGNYAVIGGEIVQFRDAVLVEPRVYDLSHFRRGLLGSEDWVPTHNAGERLVMLDQGRVLGFQDPAANIGREVFYEAVSIGYELDPAAADRFTSTGRSVTPLRPSLVSVARDDALGWRIDWRRRARGQIARVTPPATGPTWGEPEAYRVRVYRSDGTVAREFDSLSPTWTYSAADQTADHGGAAGSIDVGIAQKGVWIAHGPELRVTT